MRSRGIYWPAALITAVVVGLPLVLALYWFVHMWDNNPTIVTDPARYREMLAQFSGCTPSHPGLMTGYFPATIPSAAANVRFYYHADNMLKGHSLLQLRLTLPAAQVTQIAATTVATTRPTTLLLPLHRIFRFGGVNDGTDMLPPDFQVYIVGTDTICPDPEYIYCRVTSRLMDRVAGA